MFFSMGKYILLFVLCALTVLTSAQEPDWFDSKNRQTFYPASTYFSGFAMDEISPKADVEEAMERVKAAARAEAVSTIQVYVQSVKNDQTRSESYQTASKYMEEVYQQFSSNTTISTKMDVPGLKIDSYKRGNIVAAIAYVKKNDLKRQLERQITVGLTRIESQLENIDKLMNNGQKMEARTRLEQIPKDFLSIEKNQELLSVVDADADIESLQLNEVKTLQQRYSILHATLKNGIYISLHCNTDLFGGSYDTIEEQIKGKLSSLGCTFTNNDSEADWIININASAREYRQSKFGSSSTFFTYIDSKISIKNAQTGQVIYADEVSIKGGDTNDYIHAGMAGYKESATILSETIKKQIQQ